MHLKKHIAGALLFFSVLIQFSCKNEKEHELDPMATASLPMFVIEREIPGAGKLTRQQLKDISTKSNLVLKELGDGNIIWDHSYVTEDKVFCVYRAKDTTLIRQHAEKNGLPANRICMTTYIISPKTADIEVVE